MKLSNALYWHLVNRFMMMARGSLVSLIYTSTYESATTRSDNTESLTLMTVDVDKTMTGLEEFHELWSSVIQIAIAIYVLASHMTWASVAPVVVPLVCMATTVPISNKVAKSQGYWNAVVEKRISVTAAVLSKFKEVRMLGIGRQTSLLISKLRGEEIEASHRFRQLMTGILTLSQGTTTLGPLATFGLYTILLRVTGDPKFLAAEAFTSLSLISLVATPFGALIQALPTFLAGVSSLSRIEDYVSSTRSEGSTSTSSIVSDESILEKGLVQTKSAKLFASSLEYRKVDGTSILVEQGTFGWKDRVKVIKDLNLKIPKGFLTVVNGPIGAGKSTLLRGLLRDVPSFKGHVWLEDPNVSYCPQDPWLFSESIRSNIICGARYDASWYKQVIAACALEQDIRDFTEGDLHEVGNEGSSLSGGQRQRVSLARAVYARNRIILLDNPLSGLDQGCVQHILKNLFYEGGLLRQENTTVLIVSDSRGLLREADKIIVVNPDGTIRQATSLKVEADVEIRAIGIQPAEALAHATLPSSAEPPRPNRNLELAEAKADLRRKTGDWGVYSFYVNAAGRLNTALFVFTCLCCAFCYQFSTVWVQWWSNATTYGGGQSTGYYIGLYAFFCILGLLLVAAAAWILMVIMVTRSGAILHHLVLEAVFRAPVSFFSSIDNGITLNRFNQDMQLVDFNLPLAAVNTVLFLCICLVQAVIISVSVTYMAVAIPFVLVVIYFIQSFYLRTSRQLRLLDIEAKAPLYTNFSETIHGMPTVRAYGKEFGRFLVEKHRRALDDSQQPVYLLYTVQRWLSLVLDLLVMGLALLLIVLAVELDSGVTGSDMGVALVNLTSFNQYITNLIRYWASMETSLGAISRVKDFSRETPNADEPTQDQRRTSPVLDDEGSSNHEIVFRDVTATYSKPISDVSGSTTTSKESGMVDNILALRSINLSVAPGAKIAITGRSGSGKSTLVSTLFRNLPISSGAITIGGQDISKMDQEVVQERLNAITQTSFFLPGISLQENLDPRSLGSEDGSIVGAGRPDQDGAINEILASLGLASDVDERGGLDAQFTQSSWSTGQLQLLGLARAVIKGRHLRAEPGLGWKILVLDEATSSVDATTAALIRKSIKTEFADYTVLAILHNFEGVAEDMDHMIILEKGEISRQGHPQDILQSMLE